MARLTAWRAALYASSGTRSSPSLSAGYRDASILRDQPGRPSRLSATSAAVPAASNRRRHIPRHVLLRISGESADRADEQLLRAVPAAEGIIVVQRQQNKILVRQLALQRHRGRACRRIESTARPSSPSKRRVCVQSVGWTNCGSCRSSRRRAPAGRSAPECASARPVPACPARAGSASAAWPWPASWLHSATGPGGPSAVATCGTASGPAPFRRQWYRTDPRW